MNNTTFKEWFGALHLGVGAITVGLLGIYVNNYHLQHAHSVVDFGVKPHAQIVSLSK